MKSIINKNVIILSIIFLVVLGCNEQKEVKPFKATSELITIRDISFNMQYCPGAEVDRMPIGTYDNNRNENKIEQFLVGETEVTYQLWTAVYNWATDTKRNEKKYTFSGQGNMGSNVDGVGMTDEHPVTLVSWYDAVIWCNALTEWYNSENDINFNCVYTYNGEIIRDSTDFEKCDLLTEQNGSGFRLPDTLEWESAARYLGPVNPGYGIKDGKNRIFWTPGTFASGANQSYDDDFGEDECNRVAVYGGVDGITDSTSEVKSKDSNTIGCYDMSGNVWEWCFTKEYNNHRINRGGSWYYYSNLLQVGDHGITAPENKDTSVGFRIARSNNN